MFDRLDLYLWVRIVLMNVLMVLGLASQRRATQRTLSEFAARGWLRGS
jgi:hypothetical protein